MSLEDETNALWRSDDDGETWNVIDKVSGKNTLDVYPHPFDKKKAYILTIGQDHFVTSDQGKSWQTFSTEWPPSLQRNPLSHHATKPGYVLFTGMKCERDNAWSDKLFCEEKVRIYTLDEELSRIEYKIVEAANTQLYRRGTAKTGSIVTRRSLPISLRMAACSPGLRLSSSEARNSPFYVS